MTALISLLAAIMLAVSPDIIIPAPVKTTCVSGRYNMPEHPTYAVSGTSEGLASLESYLDNLGMTKSAKADVRIQINDRKFAKLLSPEMTSFGRDGAYSLTVSEKGIDIKALAPEGAFYALQSLRQMTAEGTELSCCNILDWPRLRYRGMMLDISRNFRDKDFIIKQLDAMALLKLNKLHLHLTDDAGWRIQIDSHPELTQKAAWRVGRTWKQWRDFGRHYAEEGSPLAEGGYLTKDDVREIVAYASERHIDVIPEFEIPGHSKEVVTACPELACIDADGKPVISSDMCPASPALFGFIEDVISELVEMFPSEFIHIGGDEASRQSWKDCPRCKSLMAENGITELPGLQSWLTGKLEKIVESHGRRLLGWDEIMEGGLSDNAVVMSWRGMENGLSAIEAGHDVIMSPNAFYYFDYTQDAPIYEPEAIGGYIPLELAYSYAADVASPHLLGVQGNVWTEFIPEADHLEYMIYPRMFAVAETGWSPVEKKDYAGFRERAVKLCKVFKDRGYNTFHLDTEFGTRPEAVTGVKHLAIGKPVKVLTPYADNYSAAGDVSINDGICGSWSYSDKKWLGFLCDVDVIIDLEKSEPLHYVGASFMVQRNNHVGIPERVEVYVSEDGENFTKAGVAYSELPADTSEMCYVPMGCFLDVQARYVRFKAFRRDLPLHAWIFTDEIVVK